MRTRTKLIQPNSSVIEYLGMGIIGALMAFAVSSAAVQYIDLDPWMMFSYMRIFIAVFFTMSFCVIALKNWKTFLVTAVIVFIIGAVISIIWVRGGFSEAFYLGVSDYFEWLWDFITNWHSSMELPWSYSYITTTGVAALITVLMYFLIVKWFIYLPVFLMSTTLFIAQWLVVREVNKFAFYLTLAMLVIMYIINVYRDKIKQVRKKNEQHEFMSHKKLILTLVPVITLLMLLVIILPKSSEPIKWEWLDNKIKYRNTGGDKPIDFKAYDQFSLASTGFSSQPGTPGGSVTLDFTHILDVYSNQILYLRGESWPYFNGTSWGGASETVNYSEPIVEYSDYNPERMMLLEPIYGWRFMYLDWWFREEFPDFQGIRRIPGPDFDSVIGDHLLPEWYEREKADVVYAGVETKSLFVPLYSSLTDFQGLDGLLAETDDTLETEKTIKLFTALHFDYLSLDSDNENLLENLRQSNKGLYNRLYNNLTYIVNNLEAYDNLWISNSIYYAIQDLRDLYLISSDYYWRYTVLSENLPERVRELAADIAEPYDNNYDKVKAIEDYFRTEFTYSLEAEEKPEGRDFTDWFIFDAKKGYCTFYATSMTTLVRSLGLPARYVEGFVTPPGPQPGSRYPVLNSNAHAWVEVYFEGIGWITFEPTPPFSDLSSSDSDSGSDLILDDPSLDDYLDELDKEDDTFVPLPGGGGGGKGFSIPKGWIIAGIIIAALAAFNLLVSFGRNAYFKNINKEKMFRLGYFELLRILTIRGVRVRKGMTLLEYSDKVDERYFSTTVSMRDVTQVYYRILYDDNSVSEEELRIIGTFYKEFRYELNTELKLWEWLALRILLPII